MERLLVERVARRMTNTLTNVRGMKSFAQRKAQQTSDVAFSFKFVEELLASPHPKIQANKAWVKSLRLPYLHEIAPITILVNLRLSLVSN